MKKFILLTAITFLTPSAYAQSGSMPSEQDIYEECMFRYESRQPKDYETECLTFGNKTECKMKTSPNYGGFAMAKKIAGDCREEAQRYMEAARGRSFSDSQPEIYNAIQDAHSAPINSAVRWGNTRNSSYGTVTPVNEGTSDQGERCREYKVQSYVSGQWKTDFIVACQTKQGKWKIID